MASDAAKKYFDRGLAFFSRNEHEKAAELFKKAIFEEPDYSEALYNLASCQAVLGEDEDAFIYLDRASKLNPQCLTWAKEDSEYDPLRNDDRFIRIFETNDIINDPLLYSAEPETEKEEEKETDEVMAGPMPIAEPVDENSVDMPKLDDKAGTAEVNTPKSNLPPCASCGGIVEEESVPKVPIFISFGLIFIGTLVSIILFSWLAIIIGLPIIIYGFYMFMQNEIEWVCQVCGARGKKAGQPITKKKKAAPTPQKAQ